MVSERWMPIPGHEGAYEVSDQGQVRSLPRVVARRFGRGRHAAQIVRTPIPGVNLRPGTASNGYLTVSLSGQTHCVHTLVLTAFRGPRPQGCDGCHRDGDRRNNLLLNLRWDTRSANAADSLMHGTRPLGERKPRAKLTDRSASEILAAKGRESQSALATRFCVSPAAIQAVHDRRTFKHVSPGMDEDVLHTARHHLAARGGR